MGMRTYVHSNSCVCVVCVCTHVRVCVCVSMSALICGISMATCMSPCQEKLLPCLVCQCLLSSCIFAYLLVLQAMQTVVDSETVDQARQLLTMLAQAGWGIRLQKAERQEIAEAFHVQDL